jgi:hypothetical protein
MVDRCGPRQSVDGSPSQTDLIGTDERTDMNRTADSHILRLAGKGSEVGWLRVLAINLCDQHIGFTPLSRVSRRLIATEAEGAYSRGAGN